MLYAVYSIFQIGDIEMAIAEKRTQVYFPMDLYRKVEKKAKKESKSMAAVVREAVDKYTKNEEDVIDWENDPLSKAVGIMKSGLGDLSVNHDYYLYGMKKKKTGKK